MFVCYLFSLAVAGCGGILSAPSGEITPPLVVGTDTVLHQNSLNCEWRIQLPINDKIKFWFTKFDVEECTENCNCDYLEVNMRDLPSFIIHIVQNSLIIFGYNLYSSFISLVLV